jgi:hypothetical protein
MERKSALFSLATASVLLVNMFETDVGRYNGANYGLLRTVLEVNLKLFQAQGCGRMRTRAAVAPLLTMRVYTCGGVFVCCCACFVLRAWMCMSCILMHLGVWA